MKHNCVLVACVFWRNHNLLWKFIHICHFRNRSLLWLKSKGFFLWTVSNSTMITPIWGCWSLVSITRATDTVSFENSLVMKSRIWIRKQASSQRYLCVSLYSRQYLWHFFRVDLLLSTANSVMGRHKHSKIWLKKQHGQMPKIKAHRKWLYKTPNLNGRFVSLLIEAPLIPEAAVRHQYTWGLFGVLQKKLFRQTNFQGERTGRRQGWEQACVF